MTKPATEKSVQQEALNASIQILPLQAGLYLFSVKVAPAASAASGILRVPAIHVGLGPGVGSGQVEFIAGPSTDGSWLFAREDCLIAKVTGQGATLVLTSVRGPGGEMLSIAVERLDNRADPEAPVGPSRALSVSSDSSAVSESKKSKAAVRPNGQTDEAVPLQINTHIRARGDMSFSDGDWAGRVEPGLWIEAFSVVPLERFGSHEIEYKGLTGSGFETPWISAGAMCGTKGMAVPLVGFAIRLRDGAETGDFDCEYSGYFKSGAMAGPSRNGAPCRSKAANDPLEGIQLRITKRARARTSPSSEVLKARAKRNSGPSFGRYRGGDGNAPPAVTAAKAITPSDRKSGTASVLARRRPARRP